MLDSAQGETMQLIRACGVATATCLALALTAPSAHAQQYAKPDPTGDMVTDTDTGVAVVPTHHNLDISRVVVRHLPHRITIRVAFDELHVPSGSKRTWYGLVGFMHVNRRAMPYRNTADGPWQWEAQFDSKHPHVTDQIGVLDAENEEEYNCYGRGIKGLFVHVDYRKDFIYASYPRYCIGPYHSHIRPKWVRVSVTSYVKGYADHWIKPTHVTYVHWWTRYFSSPRIYPGA